ncbi:MAG: SUMF1/EgtB/PvdO family nonheme iron enzyme [Ignavibacteria bacterium]|nr:SUMF1/EgtB/PvdO family nonheme iron enzyme [Ignavibacteria bacterium]
MVRRFAFTLLLAALATPALANNLQISNISLTGQNTTSDFTKVEFDISWEHSWRDNGNWDAVWLFVKWSTDNGYTWQHGTLNATAANHTAPSGSTIVPAADSTGVFIQRATSGSGTVTWTNVQLRWEYGIDGIDDNAVVLVKVFGTEMVYVPTGSFYLGDGTTSMIAGQFEAGNSGDPFLISSENPLTLGGTSVSNLSNHNAQGMQTSDDFFYSTTKSLPGTFPKGYNAFYCMKYEITQEQYRDFLNTLTRIQQTNRVQTDISGTSITNRFVMTNTTTVISRNGLRCDAILSPSDPVTFYCDYDGDGIYDESTDGQNIGMNYIHRNDLLAILDWMALRPMTELEFEKACRGPLPPRVNEWAWGDTTYIASTAVSNAGGPNEVSTTTGANCSFGNNYGVHRAGAFATASSTRRAAGSSYYGIMELSASLGDPVVSVGNSTSRSFQGQHGDGEITSSTGSANTTGWPPELGFRGGTWIHTNSTYPRVSSRTHAAWNSQNGYFNNSGGRGVRTSP